MLITHNPNLEGQALNMAWRNRRDVGLTGAGRALAKGGYPGSPTIAKRPSPIEHKASSGKSSRDAQKCPRARAMMMRISSSRSQLSETQRNHIWNGQQNIGTSEITGGWGHKPRIVVSGLKSQISRGHTMNKRAFSIARSDRQNNFLCKRR